MSNPNPGNPMGDDFITSDFIMSEQIAIVDPTDCEVMISFNDASAGEDAEELCNFLTYNGIKTFCTRVFCPMNPGDWREYTMTGACSCEILIALMTDGWQKSEECQFEIGFIKNRLAKKEVTVIPVYYSSFDKDYDRKNKHFYSIFFANYQGIPCKEEDANWMESILKLLPTTPQTIRYPPTTPQTIRYPPKNQANLLISQNLYGDEAYGDDYLDLKFEAKAFATYLSSKELKPPFVLGILGNWGSGKSFFFHMIQKELIRMQRLRSTLQNTAEVNLSCEHMYVIKFDAWTYGKQNLWASLMYRIFKDLNELLEIENIVKGVRGVSIIDIYENLQSNEIEYLKTLKLSNDGKEKIKNIFGKDLVTESFTKIFDETMKEDKMELEKAKKELNEKKWNELADRGISPERVNACIEKFVVWKIKALRKTLRDKKGREVPSTNEAPENDEADSSKEGTPLDEDLIVYISSLFLNCRGDESLKETLDHTLNKSTKENFKEFSSLVQFIVRFLSLGLKGVLCVILIIAVPILVMELLKHYLSNNPKVKPFLESVWRYLLEFVIPLISSTVLFFNNTRDFVKKMQKTFSDEIKAMDNIIDEEEARLLSETEREVLQVEMKIKNIEKRMKVLEGESITNVVRNRVNSNYYLDKLGIVHQVKEDLNRLANAFKSRYNERETRPRIVLFVDDLDRCEPQKVVEVLEAIQLLVNLDLFVVVLAIDPRYVCQSLEVGKYKDILQGSRSPTGMDFLEKIIQIPFRVPGITERNIGTFIDNQIEIERENDETNTTLPEEEMKEEIFEKPSQTSEAQSGTDEQKKKNEDEIKFETQKFSEEEIKVFKELCSHFVLRPRTVKRLINVFKIVKDIWRRRTMDKPMDLKFVNNFLLLLIMASCEKNQFEMQKMFTLVHHDKINDSESLIDFLNKSEIEMDKEYLKNMLETNSLADKESALNMKDAIELAAKFSFYRGTGVQDD